MRDFGDGEEVLGITGRSASGAIEQVALAPAGTRAANFGFDVTPARLVSAIVTERGIVEPGAKGFHLAQALAALAPVQMPPQSVL